MNSSLSGVDALHVRTPTGEMMGLFFLISFMYEHWYVVIE